MGVLIWIPRPGKIDPKKLLEPWRKPCAERNIILLVPQSLEESRWRPHEAEFVTKALANVAKRYQLDKPRIVIGGMESGGVMAGLIAHDRRDLFRGLVLLDAGLPRSIDRIEASPVNPLLVFLGATNGFEQSVEYVTLQKLLIKSKLPFLQQRLRSKAPSSWIRDVVLWADAVDRL